MPKKAVVVEPGKYKLHEIEGGWFVEWCDKDTKDRHKKTADIRLKRVEPKKIRLNWQEE
jgi:hypothetical protein